MIGKEHKKIFSWLILACLTFNAPSLMAQETLPPDSNIEPENVLNESQNQEQENLFASMPDYTWEDFIKNKSCQNLIKVLPGHNELDELYQNLKPYCFSKEITAWNDLIQNFRQEKRNLLIHQTLKNSSIYTRYFKVIPYLLFDIQKTNRTGEQPIDLLDRAETAIQEHNLQDYFSLVQKLPNDWKKELKKTELLAKRLDLIRKQLINFNELKRR